MLAGVVLGHLFTLTLDWALLAPSETIERLKGENAELRECCDTLRAQLAVFEQANVLAAALAAYPNANAVNTEPAPLSEFVCSECGGGPVIVEHRQHCSRFASG